MNNIEFLSFTKTPSEKHLGIATIRVDKRFIFRFKISPNTKGEGFFANEPAVKGLEYEDAFSFDSNYEEKEIKKFILSNVKQALHPIDTQSAPSTFQTPSVISFNFEQTPF